MEGQLVNVVAATGLLAIGIFLVMRVLHQAKWLSRRRWFARLQPFIPPLLGIAGAFGGGVAFEKPPTVVVTVIYGLIAAYGSEKGHKLLGQTVLGDDKRITKDRGK